MLGWSIKQGHNLHIQLIKWDTWAISYITQRDTVINIFLAPTNRWQIDLKLYWNMKSTIFCNSVAPCSQISTHPAWTTDAAAQGSFFFQELKWWGMQCSAVPQISDTTVEQSKRKAFSFPASVFINSGSSIKVHDGGYPVQYACTHFQFLQIAAFQLRLCVCVYMCAGGGFKGWCWPKELSLPFSLWMAPLMVQSPQPVCLTDLQTQQSLRVWKPTF